MKFSNLKLASKQRWGFGLVLALMAAVSIFSLYNMATIKNEIDIVTQNWMPRAIAISDINLNSSELRRTQLQQAFTTEESRRQALNIRAIELIDQIHTNLDRYDSLKTAAQTRNLYSAEEARLFAAFDRKWERYTELSIAFFKLIRDGENEAALALLDGEAQDVFNDFSTDLIELVEINKRDSFLAAQRAEETFITTRRVSTILLVLSIGLSILIADRLVRFITIPVKQLEKAAGRVARGDLEVQIPVAGQDEVGNLSASFNQMTNSLREARERMDRQAEKLRSQNKALEKAMRELRNTQEQLLIQEKMASLGNLVAGIAHEINNPIGTVNSSVDISRRCLQQIEQAIQLSCSIEELQKDQQLKKVVKIFRENLENTLEAGERIATLVRSLKNFSRVDEAEYQKADIHVGLESTLTLMRSEFGGRIKVVKEFAKLPRIGCYPGQLNQVFFNLFKNAAHAIAGKGTIAIKTSQENNHVRVDIADSGRGIPKNKLNKLFDIGFSSDDTRIKMTSGLSTAYQIIRKHHGDIKVESEEGKGTRFSIMLPIN